MPGIMVLRFTDESVHRIPLHVYVFIGAMLPHQRRQLKIAPPARRWPQRGRSSRSFEAVWPRVLEEKSLANEGLLSREGRQNCADTVCTIGQGHWQRRVRRSFRSRGLTTRDFWPSEARTRGRSANTKLCAVVGQSASSIARFSPSSMNGQRSRETRLHSWPKAIGLAPMDCLRCLARHVTAGMSAEIIALKLRSIMETTEILRSKSFIFIV